ncbi:MAG: AIR carboxylase family protein, partial [Candidatus Hodarchaeales archaeon]
MRDLEAILTQLKSGQISIEQAKSAINLFGLDFINKEVRMDLGRLVHLFLLKPSLENEYDFIISTDCEPYTVTITKKGYTLGEYSSKIGILTAGSSDIPVAEEAAAIGRLMGVEVISFYDVGVAGVHRLFEPLKELIKKNVKCIVVVAGMEGALPTVVSGLVDVPVIGVPTSVGYGYG